MVTTAIVAEIVVAGLQSATWITLLVLTLFGTGWIDPDVLADWAALVTVLVIGAAYMLGVLVDRLADDFVLRPMNRFWPPRPADKPAPIEHMRLVLLGRDDGVARFLDYQRSRMRVARVTLLNLLALAPALGAYLIVRTDSNTLIAIAAVAVVLISVLLTAWVFRAIEWAYLLRLGQAYRIVENIPETDIAAAICCCRSGGRLEFGLVRTGDGHGWTFPKGHREKFESLPEAALREAKEEAGITGKVDGTRLLTYRYPPSRPRKAEDDLVVAFLLEVETIGAVQREHREQAWCDFEGARERLAEGRNHFHAEQMERALTAAEDEAERRGDKLSGCPSGHAPTRGEPTGGIRVGGI